MDITQVVKLVEFLAPSLPFILNVGNKVVEGASRKIGEDLLSKGKAIWAKLQPKIEAKEAAKEAVADLAQNPEDQALQTVLQVQLQKILADDPALAEEIAQLLQEATTQSDNILVNVEPKSYDKSTQTINTVGKIEKADVVNFGRIDNPK
ncbi:MAG TPA: hypothetical protein VK203_29115 [Nostocaceae cyanobacterium]|nr:hypothetical protein [Nostocaceae cyanobacterium]